MLSGAPPFSATNHSLCVVISFRIACSACSTPRQFLECTGFVGDIGRYANIPADLSNRGPFRKQLNEVSFLNRRCAHSNRSLWWFASELDRGRSGDCSRERKFAARKHPT